MEAFNEHWENARPYLRGLLINIVRNVDLADDLLQETFVRASEKVGTYRGGDSKAWLAAIARNLAVSHMRKAYIKSEVPSDTCSDPDAGSIVGSYSHLDAVLVRDALDTLSPDLRHTLILKHFGGFTYPEIARKLGCPPGTAKRRVWTAVRQLKRALGVEAEETMKKCSEIKLLDYAYGALSKRDLKAVEEHVRECESCGSVLKEIKQVLSYLDQGREQLVFVDVNEVHSDGSSTTYSSFRMKGSPDKESHGYDFDSMKYHHARAIFADGEEVSFNTIKSDDEAMNRYEIKLPRPLPPGGSAVNLYVYDTPPGVGASIDIGFGRWVAVPDNSGTDESDVLLVQMVRLPDATHLIGSVPEADEIRQNGQIALVWKRLIRAGETRERPVVVYSLPSS